MLYVLIVETKNKTYYKLNKWFIVGKMIMTFIYLVYVVHSHD